MSPKPILGAFNQGGKPTIACFNKARTSLGVELGALLDALQEYVDTHVAPIWGTPAKLVESQDFLPNAWAINFLDDADQANALGYHDLTPDGLPFAKVFVRTIANDGESVSVTASHELVEMLVDPAINVMTTGPDPLIMYAYESADPVEQLDFKVQGMRMSDFVYPSYFETFHKPGSVRFDHMDQVQQPFQILAGEYQLIFKNGEWSQVFASAAKVESFKREDRRQHRSEQRKEEKLRPSEPTRHASAR
jgi:hypothetical protein